MSADEAPPPSAIERVQAMSLQELAQLLSKGGRKTMIVDGPDDTKLLRREKQKVAIGPARLYTIAQLLARAVAAPALLALLFLLWWRPHLTTLGASTVAGMLGGVLFAYLYRKNARRKEQYKQLVCAFGWVAGRGVGGWRWWRWSWWWRCSSAAGSILSEAAALKEHRWQQHCLDTPVPHPPTNPPCAPPPPSPLILPPSPL